MSDERIVLEVLRDLKGATVRTVEAAVTMRGGRGPGRFRDRLDELRARGLARVLLGPAGPPEWYLTAKGEQRLAELRDEPDG